MQIEIASLTSKLLPLLIVQLWQISILFAGVLAWSCWRGKSAPHFTLLLWTLFFLKCVTPPLVHSPVSLPGLLTPNWIANCLDVNTSPELVFASDSPQVNSMTAQPNRDLAMQQSSESANPLHSDSTNSGKRDYVSLSNVLLLIWFAGIFIYLAFSIFTYRSMLNRLTPLDVWISRQPHESKQRYKEIQALLEEYNCRIKGIRPATVKVVDFEVPPFSCGIVQPTIVLPASLLHSAIRIESVIAHELCHLWRRDQLTGWLQMMVQAVFWFYPLVWLGSRQLNYWCELCCDDDTMRMFQLGKKEYSSGLLDIISLRPTSATARWIPAISPAELTRSRIGAILGRTGRDRYRQNQIPIMLVMLVLLLPGVNSVGVFASRSNSNDRLDEISYSPPQTGASAQLNFLAGNWNVVSKAKEVAESTFRFEKSGRMLHEDWTSVDGTTSQGETYYDPALQKWKMTFASSDGTVIELMGDLEKSGQKIELVMDGSATTQNGLVHPIMMKFKFKSNDRFDVETYSRKEDKDVLVSNLEYRRNF